MSVCRELRVLPACLGLILTLTVIGLAQSGRRIASAPPVTTSDSIEITEGNVGYSESAVRQSIYARPAKAKKVRKEEKKEMAVPAVQPSTTVDADGDEIVKVETNLITIPVSVYDRNGAYIPSLREENFKIFEDGVEQEIAYFGTTEKPFTVVLLIDVSPSTSYKIDEIQAAASAFVDQLKPQDNVVVIQFDNHVDVLTEATSDRQRIHKAIQKTGFGGGTSLYDAVDFSLQKRLAKIEGRKAIVLFTDGVDTSSRGASYRSTLEEAEESEAVIFPIYYNTFLANSGIGTGGPMSVPPTIGLPPVFGGGQPRGASSAEYTMGRTYLNELALATGGRVFRAESTPGGLTAAFEGIAEELRRQYNIGYYPSATGEVGQRKTIKVRVNRPKLVVRSRDSYIVGSNKQS